MIDYFSRGPLVTLRDNVAYKARTKIQRLFMNSLDPKSDEKVVDIGVTPDIEHKETNYFEKNYPYKEKVTITSIEDCNFLVEMYGLETFVMTKAKESFPFEDNEFNLLFCSAVLEHVGNRQDQKFFINECLRGAKRGLLVTPDRYFPLEMHTFIPFLHWLPWGAFQKIVKVIKRKDGQFWADINNLNLLSKRNIKEMGFTNFKVCFIRTCGFKSNLVLIFDKR